MEKLDNDFQVQFKFIFNDYVLSARDTTINESQPASPKSIQRKGQPQTFNKTWFGSVIEGCPGSFGCLEERDAAQFT